MTIEVQSKIIKSIKYHPDRKILDISFHRGKTKAYYDVPDTVASTLVAAESPGTYYEQHIKGCFPR